MYKRQAPIFSICFSPFAGTSGVRFNAKLIVGFIVVIFIQVIVGRTVSYTHLDVYKRQVFTEFGVVFVYECAY